MYHTVGTRSAGESWWMCIRGHCENTVRMEINSSSTVNVLKISKPLRKNGREPFTNELRTIVNVSFAVICISESQQCDWPLNLTIQSLSLWMDYIFIVFSIQIHRIYYFWNHLILKTHKYKSLVIISLLKMFVILQNVHKFIQITSVT